ncbi:MAG: methyltransferase [Elusimicrobia bacterium]|nr:methyltransferase [Elusimicrobiota bacterium]
MPSNHPSFFSDFNKLAELVLSYRAAKPMLVALHYDLFTHIARRLNTPEELATRLGLDRRAVRLLLDAIVSLGYLDKRGGRYRNTRPSRRLLVSGSPEYVGSSLKYQEMTWDAWSDLKNVLKEGRPRRELLDWIHKDFFTADYLRAMGNVSREPARELARRLTWTGVSRTLDVGSGAGNFSAAFVEACPRVEAVLLDLPKSLAVARGLLSGHPRKDRFRYRQANYLQDSLGIEEFDLVLISNVTRVEDEAANRVLIDKAYRALRHGGRLVIHDYAIEPARTAPRFSALLGLHLLLFTGKGEVYTLQEYRTWLRDRGFQKLYNIKIAAESLHPSFAVVGTKSRHARIRI